MQDQNTGIPFNQYTIPSSFGSVTTIGPSDFINSNRKVFPGDPSDYHETLKKLQSQGATSYNPAVQSSMGLQTQPSFLQNVYPPSSQNPIPAFRQPLFIAQSGSRQRNFPPKNDPLLSPGPISALPSDTYAQAFSYNNNNNAPTKQSSLQNPLNSVLPIVITSGETKRRFGIDPTPENNSPALSSQGQLLAPPRDSNAPAFSYSPNNNAATKPSSLSNLPKTTTIKTVVNSNDLRKQFKDFNPPKEVKKMAGELMEKLNMEKNSQSSKIFK